MKTCGWRFGDLGGAVVYGGAARGLAQERFAPPRLLANSCNQEPRNNSDDYGDIGLAISEKGS